MKKEIQIPFLKNGGNMCDKPHYYNKDEIEYKNNYIFEDKLSFDYCKSYSSSKPVRMKSATDGIEYNMSMKEFLNVVQKCTLDKGVVTAQWTFKKNGAVCTLCLAE